MYLTCNNGIMVKNMQGIKIMFFYYVLNSNSMSSPIVLYYVNIMVRSYVFEAKVQQLLLASLKRTNRDYYVKLNLHTNMDYMEQYQVMEKFFPFSFLSIWITFVLCMDKFTKYVKSFTLDIKIRMVMDFFQPNL